MFTPNIAFRSSRAILSKKIKFFSPGAAYFSSSPSSCSSSTLPPFIIDTSQPQPQLLRPSRECQLYDFVKPLYTMDAGPSVAHSSPLSAVAPSPTSDSLPQVHSTPTSPTHTYIPYTTAWQWQKDVIKQYMKLLRENKGTRDLLLLVEHPPVYTLGRGADKENVKFDMESTDFEIHRIERGGQVTYHGPGQLVGYPMIDLRHYKQDLHWYLRRIEDVLLTVLQSYGFEGEREDDFTGVWVNGGKIAAIGINVSRWVTMHGFSLNVNVDLDGFNHIVPCGIEDRPVTSLQQLLNQRNLESQQSSSPSSSPSPSASPLVCPDQPELVDMNEVRERVLDAFSKVFNVHYIHRDPSSDPVSDIKRELV